LVGGKDGRIVRYTVNGLLDTTITFAPFPGISVNDITLDALGRLIAVGLAHNGIGNIVRYTLTGAIDTSIHFTPFPSEAAQAVVIT
ncbi:hypothetical protein NL489_28600, partial [Klebsiella pneumoniae]|nr:hypothetical protein [Klebsiella pneumoniae]